MSKGKIVFFVVLAMVFRNFVPALSFLKNFRRGARVVMEQFAKLSTGNRRRGSNPRLSASQGSKTSALRTGFFVSSRLIYLNDSKGIGRKSSDFKKCAPR